MNIEYKICKFSECWDSVKELLKNQWEEVDHRRKTSDLSIMKESYLSMEALDVHYVVLATDLDTDTVVGYSSMFITKSPHTSELHALTDVMYIVPELRNSGLGAELIKNAEAEAVRRGASHIMVTFKNNVSHDTILKNLEDYYSYETIYSKALKGN